MSRLPRLASSPPPAPSESAPSMVHHNLKRKITDEEQLETTDKPQKLPAIGSRRIEGVLRPSRTAVNQSSTGRVPMPAPLTKPRAPVLATATTKRAMSAPPKATIARVPSSNSTTTRVTTRGMAKLASNHAKVTTGSDTESRLAMIESALAASKSEMETIMAAERAKFAELHASHLELSKRLANTNSVSLTHRRELDSKVDELEAERRKYKRELEELESELRRKERRQREVGEDLRLMKDDLQRERDVVSQLKSTIAHQSTAHLALKTQNEALQAQNSAVYSDRDTMRAENERLRLELECALRRVKELEAEAREAETHRRKLHNMVQELKGNIRVFCRVRPLLPSEREDGATDAGWQYPDKRDKKEITVSAFSESATGQERKEVYSFTFDRVFESHTTQAEVFEEVSQLAQSCTDGYNVCIFAYGQTGSGKSFTMEGGPTAATSGMIPRAVEQVFRVTEELKTKGWDYKMEGQFLEIYNETINDLLGKDEFDKKKHEIKHEKSPATGAPTTRVTDINVVPLTSSPQVRSLLALAQSRRTVASTLMNERSSRSHSVFTLRISGCNLITHEKCEGSLNLVDLAGSERLKEVGHGLSGSAGDKDKERLKETQSINRSLSALGDVIAALGETGRSGLAGGEKHHVPYRNSKLTYLLQHSLSGNSKTLMVLNVSPMAAHLNESLTSLRFATKVNNTMIGTAKSTKQTKAS